MVNLRDPVKKTYEQWQLRRELGRRLGKEGWLFAGLPRQYGGGELDADRRFVISREFEKAGIGYPPFYDSERLAVGPILTLGTAPLPGPLFSSSILGSLMVLSAGTVEQKQRVLYPEWSRVK